MDPNINNQGQKYMCGICRKLFHKKKDLEEHHRVAHNDLDVPSALSLPGPSRNSRTQIATDTVPNLMFNLSHNHDCRHCDMRFESKKDFDKHFHRVHYYGDSASALPLAGPSRNSSVGTSGKPSPRATSIPVEPSSGTTGRSYITLDRFSLALEAAKDELQRGQFVKNTHDCGLCGETLPTAGKLESHIRRHTGEKPYKCDRCGRSFHSSAARSHHHVNHGDKRYCAIPREAYLNSLKKKSKSSTRHRSSSGIGAPDRTKRNASSTAVTSASGSSGNSELQTGGRPIPRHFKSSPADTNIRPPTLRMGPNYHPADVDSDTSIWTRTSRIETPDTVVDCPNCGHKQSYQQTFFGHNGRESTHRCRCGHLFDSGFLLRISSPLELGNQIQPQRRTAEIIRRSDKKLSMKLTVIMKRLPRLDSSPPCTSTGQISQNENLNDTAGRACPHCGMILPSPEACLAHITWQHPGVNRRQCGRCTSSFASVTLLRDHDCPRDKTENTSQSSNTSDATPEPGAPASKKCPICKKRYFDEPEHRRQEHPEDEK